MPSKLIDEIRGADHPENTARQDDAVGVIEKARVQMSQVEELPERIDILVIPVQFVQEGKKVELTQIDGVRGIKVNTARFASADEAWRRAALEASALNRLTAELRQADTQPIFEALRENPKIANRIMQLRGLKQLELNDIGMAQETAKRKPLQLTYAQQFDYACEHYILTGRLPEGLSEPIREAFNKLPSVEGRHVLDDIALEKRSLKSAIQLFNKYVTPLRLSLGRADRELKKTEADDYVPPPNDNPEMVPIDPEAAEYKVYPFYGGYYRQRVFRYDPQAKKLVAEVTEKERFEPGDLSEDVEDYTLYTFKGKFTPGKENILPMPYGALPLPSTLQTQGQFTLMRSRNGEFSLEPKNEISEPVIFEFKFVIGTSEIIQLNDEPLETDLTRWNGTFDEVSQASLEKIRSNKFFGLIDRARAVASGTRNRFTYPKEEEMGSMDARYLVASEQLLTEMADHKIANCHWGNIHASLLGRELEIPWRMPTGFFIKKHPEVDFAPITGIGHAWSEVWDEASQQWHRMDATPPQENDDEEEKDKEDMGDVEVEDSGVLEMTPEELEELKREVQAESSLDQKPVSEGIADALFKARTQLDAAKWASVLKFIKEVNQIPVPKGAQMAETSQMKRMFANRIHAPKGTLEREWEKLFALICEHRTIRKKAFRGPVRESEGTRLSDPTLAYIDIMSDSSDPIGYEMDAVRTGTEVHISEFEEDALIDLTASMDSTDAKGNIMRVEQKKMILSLQYYLMQLNRKLNDSRLRGTLKEALEIRSQVFSIHGSGRNNRGLWSVLKERKEAATEELLMNLADELDKTTSGSGDMVSALRAYKAGLTPELLRKIKQGKFKKMLTIYSDGNMYCSACGAESCNVQMHHENIRAIQEEVKSLRELGVVVQGIGFTESARSIEVICADPEDSESAVVIDDVSGAVLARQKMLTKHLKRL